MASERQHLKMLERRRDHLEKKWVEQLADERRTGRVPNQFIARELDALNWALEFIGQHRTADVG